MTKRKSIDQRQEDRRHERSETTSRTTLDITPLLTPSDVAARLKVTAEQVRSLIRSGQLHAINVGTGEKRPLYRITGETLEEFLTGRPNDKVSKSRHAIKRRDRVPDFFPALR